jgi:hypothetical protein
MDMLSLGILFAAIAGGIGMGTYFAAFHDFAPPKCSFRSQFVSMCTVGLSFLVPLSIETTLFEHGTMGMQWFAVFFLWGVFSFASTATNVYLSGRK